MEIVELFYKLDNVELQHPYWLWIGVLIIAAIIIVNYKAKTKLSRSPSYFYDPGIHDKNTYFHPFASYFSSSSNKTKSNLPRNTLYLALLFLIFVALSSPVIKTKKILKPIQQRDIVFIVDTSVSMILKDYFLNGERIDRMTVLKGVLQKFISRLQGDRMSIIVFGDQAYTLLPLTSDQNLLNRMVERIETTMAGRFNAIGDAIALAVHQATLNSKSSKAVSKRKRILVLFTDADQPTSKISPELAALLAKKNNLPIYSIAIGAADSQSAENRPGSLIYSPVDKALLKNISTVTGGKLYQAKNIDTLEAAINAISQHESNLSQQEPVYYFQPLYHYPLSFVLISFVIIYLYSVLFSYTSRRQIQCD